MDKSPCFIILLMAVVEMSYGTFNKNIPDEAVSACDDIFAPEILTSSCCKTTTIFTQRVRQCLRENVILTSCEQALCITKSFGILDDNNEVCLPKLELWLRELDGQHDNRKPNELVRSYCIAYENYKNFPSKDPQCSHWKMVNCLFFSYRLGCSFDDYSSTCKFIKKNVHTCSHYQKKYVEQLPVRLPCSCGL